MTSNAFRFLQRGQGQKMLRRLRFQDEEGFSRTFILDVLQFRQNDQISLCQMLLHLKQMGMRMEGRLFFLPLFNVVLDPLSKCRMHVDVILAQKEILFKSYNSDKPIIDIFNENLPERPASRVETREKENYNFRVEEADASDFYSLFSQFSHETPYAYSNEISTDGSGETEGQNDEEEGAKTKTRERERMIREVIMAVKLWRQLYENKRCSLGKAAKLVGLSKKSLDDYYLVLRIAQIQGYDFQANIHRKMGELRLFLKRCPNQVTGKLTKEVKCINLVHDYDLDLIVQNGIQQ